MADDSKQLRIFICTWNVGNSDPLSDAEYGSLLQIDQDNAVDVYAVGLQEIKTGARETVNSFIYFDEWAKSMSIYLSKHGYYMVENIRVQGISLCLFASLRHLPYIRFVRTEIERTGIAGAWGNKGGVAISCWMYGQKICFLNVHLAAHLHSDQERVDDVKEIFREMEFEGKATVLSHDLIFLFGDTNFRLNDLSRDFIIQSVAKKNYSVLWEKDQLMKHQKVDEILSQFEESTLNFDPTYKYDPGTDTYDTSQKKRKPAWTDRILWRIHPEAKPVKSVPPFTLDTVDGSFTGLSSFKQSDHKPVVCQFKLKIMDFEFREPLLRIEAMGNWISDKKGKFTIEAFEGVEWNPKDYVGLYRDEVTDFRSFEAFMYAPDFDSSRRDSSSDSSSDSEPREEEPKKTLNRSNTLNKFFSAVIEGKSERMRTCTFKIAQIKKSGIYKLGYYSHSMSCLLALSDSFEIS